MSMFRLSPEVAGQIGEKSVILNRQEREAGSDAPPKISLLEYVFDGWLGDDLIEAWPCFLLTRRVHDAILTSNLTGVEFKTPILSKSQLFLDLHPSKVLPDFDWIVPLGRVATNDSMTFCNWTSHDFCLNQRNDLVVTDRALSVLRKFSLAHCKIQELKALTA
jgi:hypothetical protein